MTSREQCADDLLKQHGFDAIIGCTRPTIRYLTGVDYPVTGWGAEERTFVLWTPDARVLLSPGWADPYARDFVRDGVKIDFFHHPIWPVDALVDLLTRRGLASGVIGIESEQMPFALTSAISRALPSLELRTADIPLMHLRASKEPDEVAGMKAAARAAELGMIDAIASTGVGVTEREFAQALCSAVVAHGAETISWLALRWGDDAQRMAFRDIPITPGQLINIELGCTVDGYFTDVQRMVAATEPAEPVADAYRRLQALHLRTLLGIRPGMTNPQVYAMFTQDMKETGLAEWESYFLGHAIGLWPHEDHLLWAESDPAAVVPENSFYALEPAIESPVLLSVEDTVHVHSSGNDIITAYGDWSDIVVLGQRVVI